MARPKKPTMRGKQPGGGQRGMDKHFPAGYPNPKVESMARTSAGQKQSVGDTMKVAKHIAKKYDNPSDVKKSISPYKAGKVIDNSTREKVRD